mgnify:CR=1 FL=1
MISLNRGFDLVILHPLRQEWGDQTYTEGVKELIQTCKGKYTELEDKGIIWDVIKCEICGFTVKHSKLKRKKERQQENCLNSEFDSLSEDVNNLTKTEMEMFEEVKNF